MVLENNQIVELRNGIFGVVASFNDKPFQLVFKSYTNPISRYDENLKTKNSSYDIVKIYDGTKTEGNKYTVDISIFIKYDEADALAESILSSYFERLKARKIKENSNEIYQLLGGTSAVNLARQKRPRADGLCESRKFVIEVGQKVPYIMKAMVGPGKIDTEGKGLIVPDGKSEQFLIIGFDEINMVRFARCIQRKVQAMDFMKEIAFQKKLKIYYEKNKIKSILD